MRTADSIRSREKPKEIIRGFYNQDQGLKAITLELAIETAGAVLIAYDGA